MLYLRFDSAETKHIFFLKLVSLQKPLELLETYVSSQISDIFKRLKMTMVFVKKSAIGGLHGD